jgi:hypothetical protein
VRKDVNGDPKAGSNLSNYVNATGDPTYPMLIAVRTNAPATKTGVGERRSSITLTSFARATDSAHYASPDPLVLPISCVVALNTPNMGLEAGDVSDLLGNLYSLLFTTLTAKVPDTAFISKLLFGITNLYG